MHQERENLDFLFRRIAPERVLNDLSACGQFLGIYECLPKDKKSQRSFYQLYRHYAPVNMGEYSVDELDLRAEEMIDVIWADRRLGVFAPLLHYAEKILRVVDKEPVCRLDEVLNWNSITRRLGQDVFTSCWLAWMDRHTKGAAGWSFIWPAVIRTDDNTLNQLVKRGLAENHFHLYGSTQSFIISWVCLMNHPIRIAGIAKEFKEGLSVGISRGPTDNVMPVERRLWYAALIRELLCRRCLGKLTSDDARRAFLDYERTQNPVEMLRCIEVLRANYGEKFVYFGGRRKCVDYANNNQFYRVEENSANRLLAGERSFLYHCFRMQFEGGFSAFDTMLLHLYLLLKHNFASELIQNNMLYGFHNFADYQGRKRTAYQKLREYEMEALRLSVRAGVEDNSLVSLEARIMPCRHFRREIAALDHMVQAADPQKKDWEHFYVIHFAKKKFSVDDIPSSQYVQVPRNQTTRRKARIAACRLRNYLVQNEVAVSLRGRQQRIFGIDACSKEIGCGPETFATEFRYLRDCCRHTGPLQWWQNLRQDYKALGMTYHAGEDFYDIVDGLRNIDETVDYLGLERGDRIGHAVALGIKAADFYELKRYSVYLTRQCYLDNLVWILYRSQEWNIPLDTGIRVKFEGKARRLLHSIFSYNRLTGNWQEGELDHYYASWKLRGDHPDLYSRKREWLPTISCVKGSYQYYMKKTDDCSLELYRSHPDVKEFLVRYHFDQDVKRKGLEPERLEIDDWREYTSLVADFQKRLQKKIADAGIAVECNLTSNYLIGTFRRYEAHPILRFNRHKLDPDYHGANIQASLNTDDLGIFATSLSNEYALLLCALRKVRHMEGKDDDTVIYDYLDYLRECGIRMSFRSVETAFSRCTADKRCDFVTRKLSGDGHCHSFKSSKFCASEWP